MLNQIPKVWIEYETTETPKIDSCVFWKRVVNNMFNYIVAGKVLNHFAEEVLSELCGYFYIPEEVVNLIYTTQKNSYAFPTFLKWPDYGLLVNADENQFIQIYNQQELSKNILYADTKVRIFTPAEIHALKKALLQEQLDFDKYQSNLLQTNAAKWVTSNNDED